MLLPPKTQPSSKTVSILDEGGISVRDQLKEADLTLPVNPGALV